MNHIDQFFADDHHRLDAQFSRFQALKRKAPEEAKQCFREFRAGLEQHMAWEEAILFGEFDARVAASDNALLGVTDQLEMEHAQLLDLLDRIDEKLQQNELDTETEESRFLKLLATHNRDEEAGLYQQLDRCLSAEEREELFARMEQSKLG